MRCKHVSLKFSKVSSGGTFVNEVRHFSFQSVESFLLDIVLTFVFVCNASILKSVIFKKLIMDMYITCIDVNAADPVAVTCIQLF